MGSHHKGSELRSTNCGICLSAGLHSDLPSLHQRLLEQNDARRIKPKRTEYQSPCFAFSGCGAGSFLDHLLTAATVVDPTRSKSEPETETTDADPVVQEGRLPLQRLVGIDISASALQQACKRMEKVGNEYAGRN